MSAVGFAAWSQRRSIEMTETIPQCQHEELVGMYELLDAIQALIIAAPEEKREALAATMHAYARDFPDEFFWARGALSPTLLNRLINSIDFACRARAQSKVGTIVDLR